MGAWGTAIFADDTALDVRDEWRDAILDGLSAEEATARLVQSFADYLGDNEETEKLFWIALAAAQFETGRLLPEVQDRALAIIAAGGDVECWREDGDDALARQRERVLERLAAKLRGPQPKPKRLRRPPTLSVPFKVGDVVHVHDEDGNGALVLVIGHIETHERSPVVAALDWDGGPVPAPDALRRLPLVADQYAPPKPLLIWVSTTSKDEVFGPHLGEVVATGVTQDASLDPDAFGRSMSWRLVPSAVREAQALAPAR
jgi:hypothetical protein